MTKGSKLIITNQQYVPQREINLLENIYRLTASINNIFFEFRNPESGFEETGILELESGKIIERIKGLMLRIKFNNDFSFGFQYDSNYNSQLCLFDLKTKIIKWIIQEETIPEVFKNEQFFLNYRNTIKGFSMDGTEEWVLQLNDRAIRSDSIQILLGIIDNTLYAFSKEGNIVGINVLNGKIKDEILITINDEFIDIRSIKKKNIKLLSASNQILIFTHSRFYIGNISPSLQFHQVHEVSEKIGDFDIDFKIIGNKIHYLLRSHKFFCVFDIEKEKIETTIDLTTLSNHFNNDYLLKRMEVNQSDLYFYDIASNLFIVSKS